MDSVLGDIARGLKFAALVQTLFTLVAVVYFRKGGLSARLWILLSLSSISFLLYHALLKFHMPVSWFILGPVLAGAWAFGFLFWMFSESVFNDEFRVRKLHIVLFFVIELFSFSIAFGLKPALQAFPDYSDFVYLIYRVFPQGITVGLMISSVLRAYRGFEPDLIDTRRHLRVWFVVIVSLSSLTVCLSEIYYKGQAIPPLLDLASSTLSVLIISYCVFDITRRDSVIFDGKVVPTFSLAPGGTVGSSERPDISKNSSKTLPSRPSPMLTPEVRERFNSLFEVERVYLDETLTVSSLAEKLNERDYKIRQYINRELGFRNFNEFLNHYRIKAACQILEDPEKRKISIIEVAAQSGFASLTSFNRVFKQSTGLTPKDYRKQQTEQQVE